MTNHHANSRLQRASEDDDIVAELDLAASDDTFMENNIEGAIVYTVK